MVLRLASFLMILCGAGVLLGVTSMLMTTGLDSWASLAEAVVWYASSHAWAWPLLVPLLGVIAALTLATTIVALRSRSDDSRDEAAEETAVAEPDADEIILKARRAFDLEICRAQPRTERVVDALMGVPVDLGASSLSMIPGDMVVELELVVGRRSLPITSMPSTLYERLLEQLRQMANIDIVGKGQLDFHHTAGVSKIMILLREGTRGVSTHFQLDEQAALIEPETKKRKGPDSVVFRIEPPPVRDIRTGEIPLPIIQEHDQSDRGSGLITGIDPTGEHEVAALVSPWRKRNMGPLEVRLRLSLAIVTTILVLFFFWKAYGLGLCGLTSDACGAPWKMVSLNIRSLPLSGSVTIQGTPLGHTPMTTTWPCRGETVEIRVEAEGYTTWQWRGSCPETGALDLKAHLRPVSGP